jgi:translocation and assembly module TamB
LLSGVRVAWRRRIGFFFVAVLFLLVLVGAAGLIVRSDRVSRWLAENAQSFLSERLGTKVTVGAIRLGFIPPRLRAEEVSIGPAEAPVVELPVLTVRISPYPLLFSRTLLVPEIMVERPRVHLIQTAEGWNLPPMGAAGGGGGWRAAVKEVRVVDGALRLDFLQGSVLLERISLSARPNLREKEARVSLSAGPARWREGESTQEIDRVYFEGSVGADRIAIRKIGLLRGESRMEASGTIQALGAVPVLNLRAEGELRAGDVDLIDGNVEGVLSVDADIAGSLQELAVKGGGRLASVRYQETALGEGRLSWRFERGEGFAVSFSGSLLDGPIQATAVGRDPTEEGFSYRGALRFHARRLDPLLKSFSPKLPKGSRSLDRLQWEAGGDLQVSGTGTRLTDLRGSGTVWAKTKSLAGFLTTSGAFSADGLSLSFRISAEPLTGWGEFLGPVPLGGNLLAEGKVEGAADDPKISGTLSIKELSLRGTALGKLRGSFVLSRDRLILREADLRTDGSWYHAEGEVDFNGSESDLTLIMENADPGGLISAFYLPFPVDLPTDGTLRLIGGTKTFTVRGEVRFEAGRLWGQRVEGGEAKFEAGPFGVRIDRLLLRNGRSAVSGSGRVERSGALSIRAEAVLVDPQDMTAIKDQPIDGTAEVALTAEGTLARPDLNGRMVFSRLSYGASRLGAGEVTLRTEGSAYLLEGRFDEADLSLHARLSRNPPRVWNLSAQGVDLDLAPALAGPLDAEPGALFLALSFRANLGGEGTDWNKVAGEITVSRLAANFRGASVENRGPLGVRIDSGKWTVSSFSLAGEGGALTVSGEARPFERVDLTARGELSLSLLTPFVTKLRTATGKLILSIHAAGAWSAPNLRGEVSLRQGLFELAGLGPGLWIERAALLLDEKRLFLESLDGRLGTGPIHVTGEAELSDGGRGLGSFRVFVEGEHLPLDFPPRLSVTLSPRLIFVGSAGALQEIKGEVKVDRAIYQENVTVKALLARFAQRGAETVPSPTPFIGEAKLQIALFGREGIVVDTNLAKMQLMLDLMVRGTYDHPILVGRIEAIDGNLMIQQRRLNVISGSIDFVNVRQTEPRVSLAAHTRIRQYEIDVGIQGTPGQIDLKLTSEPSLPENDIISLLTLGKTTAELSGGQGIQRTQAAALALDALFGEKIEKAIGVDRFQVGPYEGKTGSANQTRVTVEKRAFNEKLSVVFSSSLNTAEDQVVQMEYRVDPNISLVLERDELGQVGGDVRFTYRFQ